MYQIRLTNSAQKDLDRLHGSLWDRIRTAIIELSDNPKPHGYTKLKGGSCLYRIRVGEYRILYEIDDPNQTVLILRVKHRREAYRGSI